MFTSTYLMIPEIKLTEITKFFAKFIKLQSEIHNLMFLSFKQIQ